MGREATKMALQSRRKRLSSPLVGPMLVCLKVSKGTETGANDFHTASRYPGDRYVSIKLLRGVRDVVDGVFPSLESGIAPWRSYSG